MKIGIVGAGAAGLMAAATILETDASAEVFLIEKNNGLGKKVIISGGGRCNVTTGIRDIKTVLSKYPRGGKFLSSAFYRFPPEAVYDWFEAHGVPLKTEEDLRVFPQSNDGHDIVNVFETLFHRSKVSVYLNANVSCVAKRNNGFELTFKDPAQSPLFVDKLILTTGGQAYRQTGSTGDGYAFAQALGHTITPLAPSLNSFYTRETWPHTLSGLSFEEATLYVNRTSCAIIPPFTSSRSTLAPAYKVSGPFLFTHKGLSGPAVFALSSLVAFEPYDTHAPLDIVIDLFPHIPFENLSTQLHALVQTYPKKQFVTVLGFLLPKSLATVICHQFHIPIEKHAAEISKQELARCAVWLKQVPLQIIGRGAGDEFVTAGGVSLSEVDPKTMQSLMCPGLFFAGELLDIDGYTGGFNLQASWATGRLAGENACSL
jgi:predicted Rossmann fold flavoprotein